MKTEIYYFSATGNSLSIAKKLAGRLDAELISIPKAMGKEIGAQKVGLVFPVYAWGLPRIVIDFLKQARFTNANYVFAVTGCGGLAGKTLPVTRSILKKKGVALNAGFIVQEQSNAIAITKDPPLHNFILKNRGDRQNHTIEERMDEIVSVIEEGRNHPMEKDGWKANLAGDLIHSMAVILFKKQDMNYWTDEGCTGCGICVKVCPRDNIVLKDNKPVWRHNCEYCGGCINWCPNEAIQYGEGTVGKKRYRKDGVVVSDMY